MAKMVKSTAVVSVLATLILTVLYQKMNIGILLTLAITAGTIAYHFVMRLAVGSIVNAIMHNHADYRKPWYQMHSFEKKLYEKLGVKKWKGKMPTYDPSLFSVKEKSFDEIVQATCQAEIVHEIIVVFSFLPLVAVIWFGSFMVFLLTSIGAACMDLTFVMMQRYNRPRLVKMAERMK
ncbi:MAG: hypothetical protein IJ324_00650 [Lachnospiraceae bacterium]|nr:hypothetical protein [Lachnospiraceae bacterium]